MSNFFARSKADMKFLFKKNNRLTAKGKRRKRRAAMTLTGLLLILVQLVLMALFLLKIFYLDLLPMKYIIMLNVILILILLYNFTSQFTKAHIFGKFLSVLMSVVLLFGYLYAAKFASTLDIISGTTTRTDNIDIIVLKDDRANTIKDTLSYTYGYNPAVSSAVISKAIEDINADHSTTLSTKTYSSWDTLLNALYDNKEIKAIAVTDVMRSTLVEQYEDFDSRTKIVGTVKITTETKLSASDKKVNDEAFVVYISGNDGYGEISSNGRSDVNILAIVNPKTRQVLLVSTPRDYYITIRNAAGKTGLDKLTHAGNDGIEYSIDALEKLYGVTVDYYYKINFSGCVNIVDALGGITIHSEVEFTNGWEAAPESYHFVVGENDCDGEKTLAFVRERKAFGQGDLQRGKNQAAAIKGMIDKATSPAILTNYNSLLDAVSSMMLTNMSTSTITALIKGQLADSTPWNVQSYSAGAAPDETNHRNGQVYGLYGMSVVIPDYDSVNTAIQMINSVYNGEVIDVENFTGSSE